MTRQLPGQLEFDYEYVPVEFDWDQVALGVLKSMGYHQESLANVTGTVDDGVLHVYADIRLAAPPSFITINLKPYEGDTDEDGEAQLEVSREV